MALRETPTQTFGGYFYWNILKEDDLYILQEHRGFPFWWPYKYRILKKQDRSERAVANDRQEIDYDWQTLLKREEIEVIVEISEGDKKNQTRRLTDFLSQSDFKFVDLQAINKDNQGKLSIKIKKSNLGALAHALIRWSNLNRKEEQNLIVYLEDKQIIMNAEKDNEELLEVILNIINNV